MTQKNLIKILLLAASSMTVMAGAILSPALPGIEAHFTEQSDVLIKLVLTMPAVMITLLGAPLGYLADRFGRTRLLTMALLLYGIAGSAGFFIDQFMLLLISRAVLGVAVAGIMSVSTTLIGDYFEADERTRFLGIQGSFMAMGGIVFLNLGGLLAEWSWRGPFLVYMVGLLLGPLVHRHLYEPVRHASVTADTEVQQSQKIDYPRTALAFAMGFIGMTLFYMMPAQLPFLLNQRYAASSMTIGLCISVSTLTAATMSFNYGRIKRYLSVVQVYILGQLAIFAGYVLIGVADNLVLTVTGIGVAGLGFGFMMPNGNVWIMSITPRGARGRVIGGFSSMMFLGQFLSPLLVEPLTIVLGTLQHVFILAAVFSLLLGLALLPLRHY